MNKNDTGVMDPVKLEIASNGNYFDQINYD